MRDPVHTTIGEIPTSDLEVSVNTVDEGDKWITNISCKYKGTAHPEAIGTIVRQDVMVNLKVGNKAGAVAGS